MTAYLIANNHLTDYPGQLDAYRARAGALSTAAGGRYLLRGMPLKVLEGQYLPRQRNVVSAWRDAAALESFWFSDAYQKEARPNRVGTGVNDVGLFEGEGDPPPQHDKHVYMLVLAQIAGLSGASYGKAVAALLPEYGGRYLVRGAPQKVLEGAWLDRARVVVSLWPSLEAVTDFWYSNKYQKEVKPLREGTGVYDVAVFAAEKP